MSGSKDRLTTRAPGHLAAAMLIIAMPVAACRGAEATADHGIPASMESGEPRELRVLDPVEVVGRAGPGGRSFQVERRTPAMTQYPCASCHEDRAVMAAPQRTDHQDIQPVHPTTSGAACGTCHDLDDVERLTLQDGTTASLDEAYRLCAGCHYAEADAWAGGAHGKRLAGWRGPRVVMSCTACHDPHGPAFGTRIPRPGPRIPRTGGTHP